MKTLCALLLAAAVAVTAPPFPWRTYAEIPQPIVILGPTCDGEALFVTIGDSWRVLSTSTRDVFAHIENGEIDFIYLIEGTALGDKSIVVKKVLTKEEALRLYPNPCAWFTEGAA